MSTPCACGGRVVSAEVAPLMMTEQEARRITDTAKAAFRDIAEMFRDIDEPLCGPAGEFRRIGSPAFVSLLMDPSLRSDPELIRAALASAQWRAARPGWRPGQRPGHVYFIQDQDGFIKIGFAIDVKSRLKTLQTGSRQELRLVASIPGDERSEHELHRRFHRGHVRGEWFNPSEDLVSLIEGVRAA